LTAAAVDDEHSISGIEGSSIPSASLSEDEEAQRIYLVTDGIKSSSSKKTYFLAFNHFLKTTVKNQDLRALLDYKPSVIESKVISHIEFLKERDLFSHTWKLCCYNPFL
jgi:hypothetical protein